MFWYTTNVVYQNKISHTFTHNPPPHTHTHLHTHTHTLSHHLAADLTGTVQRPTTRLGLQSLLGGLVAGLARLVSEPW